MKCEGDVMRFIEAKSMIQSNHNFNLIKGCTHGCIYCDSRSECYQIKAFENVAIKKDALLIMENELQRKRQKALLSTGGMSDPYVHLESRLLLMQNTLKLIYKYGFGISVLTKSTMILRDLALYEKINERYKSVVQLTITTTDDKLAKIIEPHVSLPSERLKALKIFAASGIITGIWMTPILPYINDTEVNIKNIVKKAAEHDVKFIVSFGMGTTMRKGSREYFYKELDKSFPGLKQKYMNTYGDRYICDSPKATPLQKVFEASCETYGLLYKQADIDDLIQYHNHKQQSLF